MHVEFDIIFWGFLELLDTEIIHHGIVEGNTRRIAVETLSQNSTYLILAANRTHRIDPIDGFNYYTGGWNITNPHYLYVSSS